MSGTNRLERLVLCFLDLSFDFAQDGESFDPAQDRELVERLVEPFSNFGFRVSGLFYASWRHSAILKAFVISLGC
jgi:hypothetical protein